MQHYSYPATTLMSDYLRVGAGLAVTLGPLLALDLAPAIAVLLGRWRCCSPGSASVPACAS